MASKYILFSFLEGLVISLAFTEMADGKSAATGAPPSKAEDDAEYRAGVQAIKAKDYSTVRLCCAVAPS
jgi:hypothetical protein